MRKRRRFRLLLTILVLTGCASGSLREAKNAYNRGAFQAAIASARRLGGDPQAHLIAARAGVRVQAGSTPTGREELAALATDLKAAARGYPFPEEWANRELAAGIADWLMQADLPELAALYYQAGLEASGDDPEPGAQALAEGAIQAGLEALDRWEPQGTEAGRQLRDLERLAEGVLDDSGFPFPPGLADQALRVAWHAGRHRDAWLFGAAGWLRATAVGDAATARVLEARLEELVFPAWRAAGDPVATLVEEDWRRAMRNWSAD